MHFLAGILLEKSDRHLTSRWEIDHAAEKSLYRQQETDEAKVSQLPRKIFMFVLSGKRHLLKNVTMYCFLSKTIQPINLREVNNVARIWQIFGAKTEATARIWRLFYSLAVNLETF